MRFEGTAEVARRFSPRLVVLFAGAAKTRGAFHLTMNTNDALETAHAFPSATIVPVHCEGWAHFSESRTISKRHSRRSAFGRASECSNQALQQKSCYELVTCNRRGPSARR